MKNNYDKNNTQVIERLEREVTVIETIITNKTKEKKLIEEIRFLEKDQDGKILKLQKETQDLRDIEEDLNNKITENDKEMKKLQESEKELQKN